MTVATVTKTKVESKFSRFSRIHREFLCSIKISDEDFDWYVSNRDSMLSDLCNAVEISNEIYTEKSPVEVHAERNRMFEKLGFKQKISVQNLPDNRKLMLISVQDILYKLNMAESLEMDNAKPLSLRYINDLINILFAYRERL